jgi:hypothetical protein
VVGIVVALVLAGGGGLAYGLAQYQRPASVVAHFCADVRGQQYAALYALLAATPRTQENATQFGQVAALLDMLEGKAVTCAQANGSGAYQYRLGSSSASVAVTLTRQRQGTLHGDLHLVSERGAWKIAAFDTSLLGVNLGALQVASAYCHALRSQNYTAAYALLGSAARGGASAAQFQAVAQMQDQVDGKVKACTLVQLGATNTDATAQLRMAVTRTRLGQRQGTLGLALLGGAWKIASVDARLQGTNLAALNVAIRWCSDINDGNYADAYALSFDKTTNESEAQFANRFNGPQTIQGQTFAFKWAVCRVNPTTYSESGTTATVMAAATWVIVSNGQTVSQNYTIPLDFLEVGSSWLWHDIGTPVPVA